MSFFIIKTKKEGSFETTLFHDILKYLLFRNNLERNLNGNLFVKFQNSLIATYFKLTYYDTDEESEFVDWSKISRDK